MRVSTSQLFQHGLRNMLEQQTRLAELQEQIASGRRLLRPSDDPAAMSRSLELQQTLEQTGQFQRNISDSRSRLELQETTLTGVEEALLRARDLTLQANNATVGDGERRAIAVEVRQLLGQVMSLANATDANGDYLYAGFQGRTRPFVEVEVGAARYVDYLGDQGERFSQISASRQLQVTESGSDVFLKIPGVQALSTTADPANTGGAGFAPAKFVDPSQATGDGYRVEFLNPPTQYQVVNETSGAIVQTGSYVPGQALQFDGIEVVFTGAADAADRFYLRPTGRQSLFATLDKLATSLGLPAGPGGSNPAINGGLDDALADLDAALGHIGDLRSRVGARLNALDSQEVDNEAVALQTERTLSRLRDVDLVEAISRLQQESTTLQAAQATFVQLERLNLFDLLR